MQTQGPISLQDLTPENLNKKVFKFCEKTDRQTAERATEESVQFFQYFKCFKNGFGVKTIQFCECFTDRQKCTN